MIDSDPCQSDLEPFVMVPHDRFRAAMEMLGIDVENLFGLTIGSWTDSDDELFPLAKHMRGQGAFWRIRATEDASKPGLSNIKVRYLGILSPRHGRVEED